MTAKVKVLLDDGEGLDDGEVEGLADGVEDGLGEGLEEGEGDGVGEGLGLEGFETVTMVDVETAITASARCMEKIEVNSK